MGQNYVINYSVDPVDLLYTESVNWSSSNESVAMVVMGNITTLAEGRTTITAEIAGVKQSAEVIVSGFAVSGLNLQESCSLNVGDRIKIDASVIPSQAGLSSVDWEIKDESIATMQISGDELYITGVKKGSTVLTGRSGDVTKTCSIAVGNAVSSISLTISDSRVRIGNSVNYSITYSPSDATISGDFSIEITPSNLVTASGGQTGTITAGNTSGTVQIVAKYDNRIVSEAVSLTIDNSITSYSVSNFSTYNFLSPDASYGYPQTAQLNVTITPSNADKPEFTYTSSNPDVVRVGNDGKLTAVGHGVAEIGVSYNGKTQSIIVRSMKASSVTYSFATYEDNWTLESAKSRRLNPQNPSYVSYFNSSTFIFWDNACRYKNLNGAYVMDEYFIPRDSNFKPIAPTFTSSNSNYSVSHLYKPSTNRDYNLFSVSNIEFQYSSATINVNGPKSETNYGSTTLSVVGGFKAVRASYTPSGGSTKWSPIFTSFGQNSSTFDNIFDITEGGNNMVVTLHCYRKADASDSGEICTFGATNQKLEYSDFNKGNGKKMYMFASSYDLKLNLADFDDNETGDVLQYCTLKEKYSNQKMIMYLAFQFKK